MKTRVTKKRRLRGRPSSTQKVLAAVSYLNPLVGAEYEDAWREAVARDALQRRADNEPYSFEAYAGGRVPPHTLEAQYDFTTDGAASCFKAIAQKIALAGYDGWMEDFGEYTPLDSLQSDGSTGTAVHNRYPTDYHSVASMVTADLEAGSWPEVRQIRAIRMEGHREDRSHRLGRGPYDLVGLRRPCQCGHRGTVGGGKRGGDVGK